MSSSTLTPDGYTVVHTKARCLYDVYERKEELQHQTHYCPGCGHGTIHKMLARAIDELGIQDRTVLISPVGCSVFAYYYFDVGNIQAAHGRAPAVATAVKRTHPGSIVISYQGDGDLSAIGSAEILHAANRGENITAIFVNNAVYSMTGGQAAPTTLLGQKSTTTPKGRSALNEGYPLRMSELLATLEAPVYIARVALGDNKQIAQADRAIRRAVENQVKGLGFSLIEVLSPCPTIWKMSPVEAQHWVRDVMEKTYPLGVLRDCTATATPHPAPPPAPPLTQIPSLLGLAEEPAPSSPAQPQPSGAPSLREPLPQGWEASTLPQPPLPLPQPSNGKRQPSTPPPLPPDLHIRIAGFGGQGVLLFGEVLAEAGLHAGLEVSWLPSYGPEMRSGTSNCHVRIAADPIDTPLVAAPNLLCAMNEPSLTKFIATVPPGGWVLYNGDSLPPGCARDDLHILAAPFTRIAHDLGEARAANMVMLGALLEISGALPPASVHAALTKLVRHARWLDIDERAIAQGRALARERAIAQECLTHPSQPNPPREGVLPCSPSPAPTRP